MKSHACYRIQTCTELAPDMSFKLKLAYELNRININNQTVWKIEGIMIGLNTCPYYITLA